MGQGYSLSTLTAGSAGIDVPELADLLHERSIGDARFMKTVRARHRQGLVVAKIVAKPYAGMKFERYITAIMRERQLLEGVPNILAYHRAFETDIYGFLVRQYTYSSLYERLSTRPFLEDIEKRWIAFQLLTAVRECHAKEVYHGDIKTENALVTSWNWLYLTDFSGSFKPVYLPEDNPADFSFFFDISGRRTCYLAPERFLSQGEVMSNRGGVTWAMDIFSVGCVIAELFLETPLFNLSQLLRYRQGHLDPNQTQLYKIEDLDLRDMVSHMIQVEPESRDSADEYLNFWRGKAFPDYFYNFLHQYLSLITDPSSGRAAITADQTNLGEADDRIARIYYDFDKISYFLGYPERSSRLNSSIPSRVTTSNGSLFPLNVDITYQGHAPMLPDMKQPPLGDDGTYIFLTVVTSSIRSTARAAARLQAFDLLLVFAEHVTDEAKLDRVLPFLFAMASDESEVVKTAALRAMAQLVSMTFTASPINAFAFPEYMLPLFSDAFLKRPHKGRSELRIAYAQCLASFAEAATRFSEAVQALKQEGNLPFLTPGFDGERMLSDDSDIRYKPGDAATMLIESHTKSLLHDEDPRVRRAFLISIGTLCVLFGSAKTNDTILSHLNTYLNDADWRLKCSFFDTIVSVAVCVGDNSVQDFVLPLLVLAFDDPEESVTERVLKSLAEMANLGLFRESKTRELVDLVGRFFIHPNGWIREASIAFIGSATRQLALADQHCIVKPLLAPYLRRSSADFTELSLVDVLKKPLPRSVLTIALTWARKSENSNFWSHVKKRASLTKSEGRMTAISSRELTPNVLAKAPKNDEDQLWITRLRDAGMSADDEPKLYSLIEFLWRVSRRENSKKNHPDDARTPNGKIDLAQHADVKISTFEFDRRSKTVRAENNVVQDHSVSAPPDKPQTIADALLDASTTIGLEQTRRPSATPSVPGDRLHNGGNIGRGPLTGSQALNANESPRTNLATGVDDQVPTRTKSNAMDLMQWQSSHSKANAKISMSSANAFGRIDGSTSRDDSGQPSPDPAGGNADSWKTDARRLGYEGHGNNESDVRRFLESVHLDSSPQLSIDLGPEITSLSERQDRQLGGNASRSSWRPSGTTIAMFTEHTAAVSCIAVSPDHSFFITGADDSCVKVWDTSRLERNIGHRSRHTYKHTPEAKITDLCFIGQTHTFASCASNGTVNIVRVDCVETAEGTIKYNKLRPLYEWQVPGSPSSYPLSISHININSESGFASLIFVATNNSQIHALDLRTLKLSFTLSNPVHHGTPTTFCVGPAPHHWLLLGTSHSILDLWDLRFKIRLRSFAFPAAFPIQRICLKPPHLAEHESNTGRASSKQTVYIIGGTGTADVTMWDVNEFKCVEVYRIASPAPASTNALAQIIDLKPYTPWNPDTAPRATILNRFGTSPSPSFDPDNDSTDATPSTAQRQQPPLPPTPDRSFRALILGLRHSAPNAATNTAPAPYLLTAGPGATLRFWDLKDERSIPRSCIISGSPYEPGVTPTYEIIGRRAGVMVCEERVPAEEGRGSVKASVRSEGSTRSGTGDGKRSGSGVGSGGSGTSGTRKGGGSKGLGKEMLLQRHLDAVLGLAVLEMPYRMVVSADRSGVVFVWA